MPTDKAGRVVFVGNIPYGLSEEQVVHLLGSCGQVLSFRLVYDKDTGRPKGFGFAEFSDADAASSAVRNLNGYEAMGRTLKVDYSNEAGTGENTGGGSGVGATTSTNSSANPQHQQQQSLSQQQHFLQFQQQHQQQLQHQQQQQQPLAIPPAVNLPSAPVGVNLPDNVSAPDAISRTLSAIDPDQLLSIVGQMKEMVASEPLRVHQLLTEKPQLAYAMFQALLLMGLVDTSALAQVVDSGPTSKLPPPPQFQAHPTPLPFQQQSPMPPAYQQFPHPPLPFQHPYQQHMPSALNTPPVHNAAYPPSTIAPQAPRPPQLSEQQWESIQQICKIPQQSIDAIVNQEEKNSILAIRQQYMPYIGAIRGY